MTVEEALHRFRVSVRRFEEKLVSTFQDLQEASAQLTEDVDALQAAVAAEQADPSTHLSTDDQGTLDGAVAAVNAADVVVKAQTALLTPPVPAEDVAPALAEEGPTPAPAS